jgi:hypothetical protein
MVMIEIVSSESVRSKWTDNPRAFGKKKTSVPSGTIDFSAVW